MVCVRKRCVRVVVAYVGVTSNKYYVHLGTNQLSRINERLELEWELEVNSLVI